MMSKTNDTWDMLFSKVSESVLNDKGDLNDSVLDCKKLDFILDESKKHMQEQLHAYDTLINKAKTFFITCSTLLSAVLVYVLNANTELNRYIILPLLVFSLLIIISMFLSLRVLRPKTFQNTYDNPRVYFDEKEFYKESLSSIKYHDIGEMQNAIDVAETKINRMAKQVKWSILSLSLAPIVGIITFGIVFYFFWGFA